MIAEEKWPKGRERKGQPMAYRYDYYTVEIPSDAEEDPEERFDMAIVAARDRARLYVIPCDWRLVRDDGETITVCRKRNNNQTAR